MLVRVITSIVAFGVLLPFLIFSDTLAFVLLFQIICVICAYELLRCTGLAKRVSVAAPTYVFALALPLFARRAPWSLAAGSTGEGFFAAAAMTGFVYLFLLLSFAVFSKGKTNLADLLTLFSLEFYVNVSFSSVILLRDMPNGKYFYLLVFLTAWGSDTFAYFCGRLFGRHKLIPEISPKKTVEGAIGGVICCVGLVLLYGFVVGKIFDLTPRYLALAAAGAVMSVASMLGDLVMSAVKRHYGAKDYGIILPGHGGLLDRFDSVLATAPFLFLLTTIIPNFALFA